MEAILGDAFNPDVIVIYDADMGQVNTSQVDISESVVIVTVGDSGEGGLCGDADIQRWLMVNDDNNGGGCR